MTPPRNPGDDYSGSDDWDDEDDDQEPDSPDVERTKKIRNVIVGVLVVLGMIWVGVAVAGGSGSSPKSYITSTYTRATNLDESGVDAYTSTKDPQAVASEISAAAEPIDRRTSTTNSAQNGGSTVFLQYSDDIVALFPYSGGGTKVMLSKDYRTAHSHYFGYVGGWWTSTPHSSGGSGGSGYRGGGGGSGK